VLQDSESQGVKAALTFGLCCGHAWSDYVGEVVVVWSWWCGSSCLPLLVCCSCHRVLCSSFLNECSVSILGAPYRSVGAFL
jgi:hypothetical protein